MWGESMEWVRRGSNRISRYYDEYDFNFNVTLSILVVFVLNNDLPRLAQWKVREPENVKLEGKKKIKLVKLFIS